MLGHSGKIAQYHMLATADIFAGISRPLVGNGDAIAITLLRRLAWRVRFACVREGYSSPPINRCAFAR